MPTRSDDGGGGDEGGGGGGGGGDIGAAAAAAAAASNTSNPERAPRDGHPGPPPAVSTDSADDDDGGDVAVDGEEPPPSDDVGGDAGADVLIAAVEGGGTTFVVSIARVLPENQSADPASTTVVVAGMEKLSSIEIPTSDDPSVTLDAVCSYLRSNRPVVHARSSSDDGKGGEARRRGPYGGVGVACFGPLGVNSAKSPETYGRILGSSPKEHWRDVDLLTPILGACAGDDYDGGGGGGGAPLPPHRLDTDVNAPAVAEFRHERELFLARREGGSGDDVSDSKREERPITSLAYVTVGTGVGVGLVVNSQPVHGLMHPEGGHVCIAPLPGDTFPGYSWGGRCPYRGINTVEGVASSVALVERLQWDERERERRRAQIRQQQSSSTGSDVGPGGEDEDGGGGGEDDGLSRQGSETFFDTHAAQEEDEGGATTTTMMTDVVLGDDDVVHVATTKTKKGEGGGGGTDGGHHQRDILKLLPDDHPAWDHAANAVSNLCATLVLLLSVERIVLGGGIMRRGCLFDRVRAGTVEILNGYVDAEEVCSPERARGLIRESTWGDRAGVVGAMILGKIAFEEGGGAVAGAGGGSGSTLDGAGGDGGDVVCAPRWMTVDKSKGPDRAEKRGGVFNHLRNRSNFCMGFFIGCATSVLLASLARYRVSLRR